MLRKILISLAGLAFAVGFLACQSDEDVTGPVNLNEDGGSGCYGLVYTASGPSEYPYVTATDVTYGNPPAFDNANGDEDGWYDMTVHPLRWKHKNEHDIKIEAWPGGGKYGYVVFTYLEEFAPARIDVYCE
jgi:hypothetical protein